MHDLNSRWQDFQRTVCGRIPQDWSAKSILHWLGRFNIEDPDVVRELLNLPQRGEENATGTTDSRDIALVHGGHLIPWQPHLERFISALSETLAPQIGTDGLVSPSKLDTGQVRRVRDLLNSLVPLLTLGESVLTEVDPQNPAGNSHTDWREQFADINRMCRDTGLRMLLRQLCERATATTLPDPEYVASLRDLLLQLLQKEASDRAESCFGPLVRPASDLPHDQQIDLLIQLFQRVRDTQLGSSRMLFPVYVKKQPPSSAVVASGDATSDSGSSARPDWWPQLDETAYGALIEVTFTSVRRADLVDWPVLVPAFSQDLLQLEEDAHLFVAPWSRYLPNDDSTDGAWSFSELRTRLIPLLRDLLGDRASCGQTGPVGDLAEDLVVLVEFEPVSFAQPGASNKHPGQDVGSLLSPRTTSGFSGPSLGLAFALAGWAASEQLSMPMCIATGEIIPEPRGRKSPADNVRYTNGMIMNVGGIPQKAAAIADYVSAAKQAGQPDPPVFMPAANRKGMEQLRPDSSADQVDANQRATRDGFEWVSDLKKFFDAQRHRLTDGMDVLRNRFRSQQQSGAGCFQKKTFSRVLAHWGCRHWKNAPMDCAGAQSGNLRTRKTMHSGNLKF